MSTPAPDGVPPLPQSLLDEVRRDCAALAGERRRRLALFAGLSLAVVAGFGVVIGRSPDGWKGPGCGSSAHLAIVAGFALTGLALVALAFGLALPAGRRLKAVPASGLGLGLAGLAGVAVLYGQPVADHGGVGCLVTGGAVSLVLVGLALALGRGVIRRHAPSSALFGVGVGLLALIPLSMGCHDASMPHLMVWHGLIPVVGGLLGVGLWRFAGPD